MANGVSTEQFLAGLRLGVTSVNESFLASIPGVQQATQAVAGFGTTVAQAQATTQTITNALTFLKAAQRQVAVAAGLTTARATGQTAAQRIAAASTRVWATAQTALNKAFRANPVGFVVTALQLLVSALVTAYQNSQTFRNIVQSAFRMIRNVATTVFNAIKSVVMAVWPHIQTIIKAVTTAIRNYVQRYFTVARTIVTTVFNAIRTIASMVWNGIKAVVTGAVNTVVAVVGGIRRVYEVVSGAFGRAREAVGGAIGRIVSFVRGLPGKAVSALGNIGSMLVNKGKELISGFLNGIKNAAGNIITTIKNFVTDKIPGFIKNVFGIGSPSKVMATLGEQVGAGFALGIEDSRRRVARAMNRLVRPPTPTVAHSAAVRVGANAFDRHLTGAARGSGVNVNIYPRPGQSEQEIGRIAARELAWAAKR